MGFTEMTFLFVFMPVTIITYLIIDKLFHNNVVNNAVLVFFSFLFYFWSGKETLVVFAATGILVFFAGNAIESAKEDSTEKQTRKKCVVISVTLLASLLIFYKYIALISNWIRSIGDIGYIHLGSVIAPIGISFVVFEAISYLIDIYRCDAKAGTLLECFTFLSLFPKLVSGPIVLWKDFQPQLRERKTSGETIAQGIDRIIIGYAKKAIIADTFATQIININGALTVSGVDVQTMWLRAVLYFFQLYFDFAGYSDIAIGLCDIFGFSIKENFHYPYLSQSISEFWRRWHISLGAWFREYIYIPMGGNRKGNVYFHLFIVFLLTGIWHGTGIQFWVWGGIHGILVVLERSLRNKRWYQKIPGFIKWGCTVVCVFFAWIVFMSKDLASAGQSIRAMFIPMTTDPVNFTWQFYLSRRIGLFLIIAILGQMTGVDVINRHIQKLTEKNIGRVVKRVILLSLFIVDILYIVSSTYRPFIYFQF